MIDPRLAIRRMQDDYDQQAIAIPQADAVTSPADKPAVTIAPPPTPVDDAFNSYTPAAINLPKSKDKADNKLATDQNRVSYLQKSGSGIDQIMHPVDAEGNPDASKKPGIGHRIGSVLARVGDIAGTALVPGVMAQIPGTSLHHQMLTNQAEHNITNDLDVATKEQKLHPEQAKPSNEFELWLKQNPNGTVRQFNDEKGGTKLDLAIQKLGFKRDEQGNVIADPDSPVTKTNAVKEEYLQAQIASTKAGTDLKEAQEELARTRNDPNSPAYQLALKKLDVAKMNSESMALRGRAAWANYLMHSQGVGESGTTLPGAMLDDQGNSVGTAFSQNVRPTGQERGKADLANSADEQLRDMKSIVQKRPDIFGPAAGRTTDFTVWMGSQDPDAQKFRAARTIAGDHLAGVFGGRSEAALTALDAAIGHYKDNPKAIVAGLDQLSKANSAFVKAGTVRTKGGSHDNSGKGAAATASSHTIKVNGKNYQYKGSGDTADLKNYSEVK